MLLFRALSPFKIIYKEIIINGDNRKRLLLVAFTLSYCSEIRTRASTLGVRRSSFLAYLAIHNRVPFTMNLAFSKGFYIALIRRFKLQLIPVFLTAIKRDLYQI